MKHTNLKHTNIKHTNIKCSSRGIIFILLLILMLMPLVSCTKNESKLHDGYYTAEVEEFDDHGWKEFITIYVQNNRIVTVEYNAKNPSGFIKSWDMSYMAVMNARNGTYPNEYTRNFAAQLLADQKAGDIDVISGATHSYHTFEQLAEAVLEQAHKGDTSVIKVEGYVGE